MTCALRSSRSEKVERSRAASAPILPCAPARKVDGRFISFAHGPVFRALDPAGPVPRTDTNAASGYHHPSPDRTDTQAGGLDPEQSQTVPLHPGGPGGAPVTRTLAAR